MERSPGAPLPSSPEEEEEEKAVAEVVGHGEVEAPEQEEAAPVVLKKGPWTTAEDAMLVDHVRRHGEGNWNAVQRLTGLLRCGKSCRLRWTNHLRPNLKKGSFSPDEELLIAQLHAQLGNKWARMAAHLPGRTDNEIKNYWNTRTKRRQRAGLPVYPPEVQLQLALAKRRRYAEFPPDLSPGTALDAAAASAGYTSSRPAPLDLARQLAAAATSQAAVHQFLSPPPFSAPSSPWAKPFARNAQYFQLAAHSSPVSPSTPDLSLGYGLRGGGAADQSRLAPAPAPLSPSPGPHRVELPSNQFGQQATPPASPAAVAAGGFGDQHQHQNAASLEKMLQELHDAIKVEPAAEVDGEGGGAVLERHGGGTRENKSDDMDTLFDLMIPTLNAPETVPLAPATAPNHSGGSTSQHSSDDQDPPAAGGASSSDQDWGLDSVCQWNNMSRIC
ncbi:unnamed protein product [Urochloa humidicola]